MLVKDIPLTAQLALLNEGDKNEIGEIIFGNIYDQDCVDKIWEYIKPLQYLETIKILKPPECLYPPLPIDTLYKGLNGLSIIIEGGESDWDLEDITVKFEREGCIDSLPCAEKVIMDKIKSMIEDFDREIPDLSFNEYISQNPIVMKISRWCLAPYIETYEWTPDLLNPNKYRITWRGNTYTYGHLHSPNQKLAMLSDYMNQLDQSEKNSWERECVPREYMTYTNNQGEVSKVCQSEGQDPRRRHIREQYHIISENVDCLSDMWGIEDEDILKEKIADWNVKANLWTTYKDPNGRIIFKKNQSDIKFYKDYLKIQLGLLITPYKNSIDKIGYDKGEGKRGFYSETHMGFRKGRWRRFGIGETENYNCSLLNYIGREKIFQNDGEGMLFIRDGQYIIKN